MTTKEHLIAKLYRGECSREELELLLDYFEQDPSEDHTSIMDQLWDELRQYPELERPTSAAILKQTLVKIENQRLGAHTKQNRMATVNASTLKRRRLFKKLSVAAVLFLLLGLMTWLWPSQEPITIKTAFGEQRTVALPDQSLVKLNANSSITFYPHWNTKKVRQVWLEGEAYFEVHKNQEQGQKFQVITRDLTVEVLGTVFNVNTREEATMVFLEEGKVKVDLEEAEEDIQMDPGEMVTYSVKTHLPQKRKVEREAPASWKDGTILFQDQPLSKIIEKMEEIYGISAVVEQKTLLAREFNVSMPVNNLDTAYQLLRELTGLDIEKNASQLIIK